ncbi:hypothetical protein [Tenacibaculum soleae]|uniref:hypothetical protein n=1 Tax=Tenacibaculum soleae TaxID=447689 RepID=UPI002300091A|nr:hypothetical protein [Tenacibaculum soleae]
MQPHIKKAYRFLETYLPSNYTEETQAVLKKSNITVSSAVIRNVKNNRRTNNLNVLNALLQVAKKNKQAVDSLNKELEPIN